MADINFDGYRREPPRFSAAQVQRLIHMAGAGSSLALVIGLGIWGYNVAHREVVGLPVFHAAEMPLRVAPQNPGGNVVSYQGMAVNVIAAAGGRGENPEQIILAPLAPMLDDEDVAGLQPLLADGDVPPLPASAFEAPASAVQPAASLDAMGDDLAGDDLAEDVDAAPLVNIPGEPPVRSLRPVPRAASKLAPVDLKPIVVAPPPPVKLMDPALLKVGDRLVQLGAFDSADIARREWSRLQGRFGDLMGGKAALVQTAESGGRTFYRLRAHGFGTSDDSRRFCAALQAEGAACIPVTHR